MLLTCGFLICKIANESHKNNCGVLQSPYNSMRKIIVTSLFRWENQHSRELIHKHLLQNPITLCATAWLSTWRVQVYSFSLTWWFIRTDKILVLSGSKFQNIHDTIPLPSLLFSACHRKDIRNLTPFYLVLLRPRILTQWKSRLLFHLLIFSPECSG